MIQKVNISDIIINKDNRRKSDKDKVKQLAESIKQIGLLNPITMNNNNELLAGLHRLEACKSLGMTKIEANLIGGGYLEFELAEIDENLIRNDLNHLERAENLARRKEIYEELYPETKHGAMNKSNNYGKDLEKTDSDFSKKESFVKSTAKLTNISPTIIKEEIALSNNIIPEVKDIIRNEPIADKKTELLKLSKQEPEVQKEIVTKIINKEIDKVDDYFEPEIKQIDNDVIDLKNDLLNMLIANDKNVSIKCKQHVERLKNYAKNM